MDEEDLLYGDLNEDALKPVISLDSTQVESENKPEFEEEGVIEKAEVLDKQANSVITVEEVAVSASPVMTMPFLHLYPIDNYTFGSKESVMEIETSYHNRMARLADDFRSTGMRRTVEAVLLTYQNNHPHVLLLQLGESSIFKLPGDTLKSGEDEYSSLSAKLAEKLAPSGAKIIWDVDPECLGVWYRPNFDNPVYPYVPAHVTRPKERITLFLVRLPPNQTFAVPRNVKMMAVPLCDLHENASRYGPIIAGLPLLLSKFNIICS